MCWPRNPPTNIELFKEAVADFFNKSKLRSLPSALRDGRSNLLPEELIVFIDEPDRNPYDMTNNLIDTPQRGTS
jgi:hypothetical protein